MLPRLSAPAAELLDELAVERRIIGWSEGIHNRAEYLTIRNAAIRHLIERRAVQVIAAETNFALSRPVDSYIRGLGPAEPAEAVVRGVWSWGRAPLRENLRLLRWLRRHNAGLAEADQVRFYGLDMYGFGPDGPTAGRDALVEADDVRHAGKLHRWLTEHRGAGGDHRDLSVRDAAQYASLEEVASRHRSARIFLFEQVEHLDRRIPGSLGELLARGELGPACLIGALWRDGDPSVTYPLGPYQALSQWIAAHRLQLLAAPAGAGILDLRPWRADRSGESDLPVADAAAVFDAMLYVPALSPAPQVDDGASPHS